MLQRAISLLTFVLLCLYLYNALGRYALIVIGLAFVVLTCGVVFLEYARTQQKTLWMQLYGRALLRPFLIWYCKLLGVPVIDVSETPVAEPILKSDDEFELARRRINENLCGQSTIVNRLISHVKAAVATRTSGPGKQPALGTFLLMSPQGRGKRTLAAMMNRLLYKGQGKWVAVDFNDDHQGVLAANALLGDGRSSGKLAEALSKSCYCTILLEHIDGASPEVLRRLRPLLEGTVTDPLQGPLDLRHSVIFVTSRKIPSQLPEGEITADLDYAQKHEIRKQWQEALRGKFDLNILSLITDYFVFEELDDMQRMAVVEQIMKMCCKEHEIELQHVSPNLVENALRHFSEEDGFGLVENDVRELLKLPISRCKETQSRTLTL